MPKEIDTIRSQVRDLLIDGFSFRSPPDHFDLHSGGRSPWVMDTYYPLSGGDALRLLGKLARRELEIAGVDFDAIGGKPLGSYLLTFAVHVPTGSEDGGKKWFAVTDTDEGIANKPLSKDRLVIVENTTTTGREMFDAIDRLEEAGCGEVVAGMSIFDRSRGVVAEKFAERGIPYIPLFTLDDFPVASAYVSTLVRELPEIYDT